MKETLLSDLNGALAVVSVPSCTAQATPPTQIVGKHSHSGNTEPDPDNDPAAGPSPLKRPCRSTPLPVFTSASSSSSPGVQVQNSIITLNIVLLQIPSPSVNRLWWGILLNRKDLISPHLEKVLEKRLLEGVEQKLPSSA